MALIFYGSHKSRMTNTLSNELYFSGISGLQLPVPKYLYPPEHQNSTRLSYYSTFFNSIEINSSFYKVPMASTVAKWALSVPENFKFTFKLWKEITHVKGLNFIQVDVEHFLKSVSNADGKKGCLLIQFPPSLGIENKGQLVQLLNCIKDTDPGQQWKIAVEFRNKSWYVEEVYKLMKYYNSAVVIQDIPKSATPMIDSTADFVYVRFHGPTGNYRDSYSDAFLSEYAGYIKEWIGEGKSVYVYFNNTMGDAFKNLEALNKMHLMGGNERKEN